MVIDLTTCTIMNLKTIAIRVTHVYRLILMGV